MTPTADDILRKHLVAKLEAGQSTIEDRTEAIFSAMEEYALLKSTEQTAEIERLEQELLKPFELRCKEFVYKMGEFKADFEHPLNKALIETMVSAFQGVEGAYNYLTLTATHPSGEQYEFIIQKKSGKTPATLHGEAKAVAKELYRALDLMTQVYWSNGDAELGYAQDQASKFALAVLHRNLPYEPTKEEKRKIGETVREHIKNNEKSHDN